MGLAVAFAVSSFFTAGLSAAESIQAGHAAKRAGEAEQQAAESQAQLFEWNAGVSDSQAADAIGRGEQDVARFGEQVRVLIGSQRAGFAAGNVDVTGGSALHVQHDAEHLAALDVATLRANAAREAFGFRTEATDLRKRADIARRTGKYALEAARSAATRHYLGAATTVLGTTTSLLETRYGYSQRRSA